MSEVPTSVPTPPSGDDDVEPTPTPVPSNPQQPATDDALGDAGKQAIDRMKAERDEAKRALRAAQRDLQAAQQASMSESERAIAEAVARGRQEATSQLADELVRARFDALAVRRNADYDTREALEYVDLSKFRGEDGLPDVKALQNAVNRLVPESSARPPSFDGGVRTPSSKVSMNDIIRGQALGNRTVS